MGDWSPLKSSAPSSDNATLPESDEIIFICENADSNFIAAARYCFPLVAAH